MIYSVSTEDFGFQLTRGPDDPIFRQEKVVRALLQCAQEKTREAKIRFPQP
jgi:hypothetical protein